TNYPGGLSDVAANLLILDGEVIGGDISSTLLDGFMHGFDPAQFPAETAPTISAASRLICPRNTLWKSGILLRPTMYIRDLKSRKAL
ncbi:MAG: hypothetical protein IKM07_07185, partial [Clostridia bacterium]|nr:hypothetical protein [Clostridia bacterium]